MIAFKLNTVVAFLSLKVQAGAGLTPKETRDVGGTLKILEAQIRDLETRKADVIDFATAKAQREAEEWCRQQGLVIPPRGPNEPGPGDAA